jgi:hypothetical protein
MEIEEDLSQDSEEDEPQKELNSEMKEIDLPTLVEAHGEWGIMFHPLKTPATTNEKGTH